jgi:hypothetical protein
MATTDGDDDHLEIRPFFRRREEAFETIASAVTPRDVITSICEHAMQLFRCDACVVCPYDENIAEFLSSDVTAAGLDDQSVRMAASEPAIATTLYTVLRNWF